MTAKITQGLSCLDDALRRPVLHRARRVIDLADLRPPDEVGDGGRDVAHSGSRGLDLLVVVLALGGQCQEFVQAACAGMNLSKLCCWQFSRYSLGRGGGPSIYKFVQQLVFCSCEQSSFDTCANMPKEDCSHFARARGRDNICPSPTRET